MFKPLSGYSDTMEATHKIFHSIEKNTPVIFIEGDMTSEADQDMMEVYTNVRDNTLKKLLVINFDSANYINSAGIATLINVIQDVEEKDAKVSFVGLSSHFKKVMEIVGIADFVDISDTLDEALSKTQS